MSDYPAPFWWLTFPLIHSCSCCPRWTRGWLDGRSCWAFPQPGQFLCSSGWLLSVSDHHHLGTQGEKGSASIPKASCTDKAKEKQRRCFRRPAWHLSHNIFLTQPCFTSSSWATSGTRSLLHCARPSRYSEHAHPPHLLQPFVPINHPLSRQPHQLATPRAAQSENRHSWDLQPDVSKPLPNPMSLPQVVWSSTEWQVLVTTQWAEGRKRPGSTRGAVKAGALPDWPQGNSWAQPKHSLVAPERHQQWKALERTSPLGRHPQPQHRGN